MKSRIKLLMEAARSRPRREWRGEPACRPPTGNEDQITPEEIEQARQLAESMLSQKDWQLNLQAYGLMPTEGRKLSLKKGRLDKAFKEVMKRYGF